MEWSQSCKTFPVFLNPALAAILGAIEQIVVIIYYSVDWIETVYSFPKKYNHHCLQKKILLILVTIKKIILIPANYGLWATGPPLAFLSELEILRKLFAYSWKEHPMQSVTWITVLPPLGIRHHSGTWHSAPAVGIIPFFWANSPVQACKFYS